MMPYKAPAWCDDHRAIFPDPIPVTLHNPG
jgi:hypothetical protein